MKKTVSVNVIKSFDGFKAIQNFIAENKTTDFNVKEISTGKVWYNFGGFNGNIWDLWLRKVGTNGSQSKTFIRAYVKEDKDIIRELRWLNLWPKATPEEIEKEKREADEADTLQKKIIDEALTKEDAEKWVTNNEGNSHTRRTRWGNRATRLGASRNYGSYLQMKAHELININH